VPAAAAVHTSDCHTAVPVPAAASVVLYSAMLQSPGWRGGPGTSSPQVQLPVALQAWPAEEHRRADVLVVGWGLCPEVVPDLPEMAAEADLVAASGRSLGHRLRGDLGFGLGREGVEGLRDRAGRVWECQRLAVVVLVVETVRVHPHLAYFLVEIGEESVDRWEVVEV